jgi:hypothetical protein
VTSFAFSVGSMPALRITRSASGGEKPVPSSITSSRRLPSERATFDANFLIGGSAALEATIAAWSASIFIASTRAATALGSTPARLHSSSATGCVTRENSSIRVCATCRLPDSWRILMSIPSSTPCGCGLISCASGGSRSLTLGKCTDAPFGGLYVSSRWGLATTVCSRYASTEVRPPR